MSQALQAAGVYDGAIKALREAAAKEGYLALAYEIAGKRLQADYHKTRQEKFMRGVDRLLDLKARRLLQDKGSKASEA